MDPFPALSSICPEFVQFSEEFQVYFQFFVLPFLSMCLEKLNQSYKRCLETQNFTFSCPHCVPLQTAYWISQTSEHRPGTPRNKSRI